MEYFTKQSGNPLAENASSARNRIFRLETITTRSLDCIYSNKEPKKDDRLFELSSKFHCSLTIKSIFSPIFGLNSGGYCYLSKLSTNLSRSSILSVSAAFLKSFSSVVTISAFKTSAKARKLAS